MGKPPSRRRTRKQRRTRGGALPKTYFIVTASLIQNGNQDKREREYREGIQALQNSLKEFPSLKANSKIIIVENNGKRPTFLEEFGEDVLYTDNNFPKQIYNKGVKEIMDVIAVMDKYNIQGDDMVVKVTGRYTILPNSPFMKTIAERSPDLSAVVRVGWFDDQYGKPSLKDDTAVVTGLVALKAKYVRQIQYHDTFGGNIEDQWGAVVRTLPEKDVTVLQTLGLDMPVANGPVRPSRGGRRKNVV
jgi:hypothetical protein